MFTKQPNSNGSITRAEGSDVVLTCEATGAQKLMYNWERVSKSLPSNVGTSNKGRSLTIHNIKKNNEGQYYCEVSNGGNKVSSSTVQVTVKSELFLTNSVVILIIQTERPSISNPSNKELSVVSGNERVTLICNVTGDDIAGGYWERMDGVQLMRRNNMSLLSDNKRAVTIKIIKARPDHSGKYRCVAYSQWGVNQSRNVRVTITSESNNVLM